MSVDLTTSIDREDTDRFGFAIRSEEDAPTANAGLSDSGPIGEGRGQARIEGVDSKLNEAGPKHAVPSPGPAGQEVMAALYPYLAGG